MSTKTDRKLAAAIVELSHEGDGRIFGYALSKRSGVRPGILYPQIDRMMATGWLEAHWEEQLFGRLPRRYYTPTPQGLDALAQGDV